MCMGHLHREEGGDLTCIGLAMSQGNAFFLQGSKGASAPDFGADARPYSISYSTTA